MIKKALSLINSVKKISNEGSKMGEDIQEARANFNDMHLPEWDKIL